MDLEGLIVEFPFIEYCISSGDLPPGNESFNGIDRQRLSKLLNSNLKFPRWLDYSEIASDTIANPGQLDLLGHSNEPVLITETGFAGDFCLFKFKRHETAEDLFYGKDQKYLIQKCLILALSNFVKKEVPDKEDFEKYFQICKNQLFKINHLNDELTRRILEGQKFFTSLFKYFLREEISPETKISLSDSTLDYLEASDMDFSELEIMAKEAYKTALALSPSSTDIRIRRYFFPEQSQNKSNKTDPTDSDTQILKPKGDLKPFKNTLVRFEPKSGEGKSNKTIALLDRYELAVKMLLENRLPIMGKNIANACIPKISAPALTDSINKHRDRIIECLKLYPDKWPLLRSNYQAVQKLAY